MMKLLSLALALSSATAFVPPARAPRTASTKGLAGNGWEPDAGEFCFGLPGALAPVGDFDPAGFTKDADLATMMRYREAEVTHGRVSMLAVLGFLVAESFHPLFGGAISGPAIRHLDQVREIAPPFFEILSLFIALAESWRVATGWAPPNEGLFTLKEDYYPGDIGFDPAGLKPEDPAEFAEMATKELQHCRVAMLAAAGFIAQELVNGVPIVQNLSA